MFIYDDLERNFDIIKYYFTIFKDEYKIENEFNNLTLDISSYLRKKVSKLFDVSNRVSKILQIGFDPYKIIIFLYSSDYSKITILHNTFSDSKNKECFEFLNVRFSGRLQLIDMKIQKSLSNIVTYSFEKYNIIDMNVYKDVYFRLCYYLSNNKSLLICSSSEDIEKNKHLKEILNMIQDIEKMYILNYNFY